MRRAFELECANRAPSRELELEEVGPACYSGWAWTGDLDAHPFWAGVEALDLVALPEVLSANETGGIFFPNPARQRITSRASRFDKSQIREAIHFTKFAIY